MLEIMVTRLLRNLLDKNQVPHAARVVDEFEKIANLGDFTLWSGAEFMPVVYVFSRRNRLGRKMRM